MCPFQKSFFLQQFPAQVQIPSSNRPTGGSNGQIGGSKGPTVGSSDPQRWNQLKLRMKSEGWNLADTAYDMHCIKSRMKYVIDVTTGYDGQ